METLRSETTRLRRTFNYPSDSDAEDAVEDGMDEQDQETLLSDLSTHDTHTTNLYTKLLLILPLVPALFHLPQLLSFSAILPTLAAITSFLASAYALYYIPLPPVRVNVINISESGEGRSASLGGSGAGKGKGIARGPDGSRAANSDAGPPRPVPWLPEEVADILRLYIVPVNAAVCGVLALAELWRGREWAEGVSVGGGYLPGLIFVVVLWARRELRVVDLGELERLRFRTKGN